MYPPVTSSILTAARRRASVCPGSCPETRRRCTTPVRRNGGCRIPVRSVWVWSTVRSERDCNGIFPKTTRPWHVENWTRRPASAVCRPAFSTAVESRAGCPGEHVKCKSLKNAFFHRARSFLFTNRTYVVRNVLPLDFFFGVFLLFQFEYVLVEVHLQILVGVVNAQLFKTIFL